MASLIGHALGSLAVFEAGTGLRRAEPVPLRDWKTILAPVALAVGPDLDVLVSAHRGPSHSLVFALGLAVVAALAVWRLRKAQRFWRILPVFAGCAAAHPLLDWLMGCGPPVPFFWPFLDRGFLSPVQLIPTAYYATSPWGLIGVALHPRTWAGIFLEALSLGGLWLAARSRTRSRLFLFLGCSLAGFGVTWALYR